MISAREEVYELAKGLCFFFFFRRWVPFSRLFFLHTATSRASDIEPVDGDVEIFLVGRFFSRVELASFVDVFAA